jgi:hypothetical protein
LHNRIPLFATTNQSGSAAGETKTDDFENIEQPVENLERLFSYYCSTDLHHCDTINEVGRPYPVLPGCSRCSDRASRKCAGAIGSKFLYARPRGGFRTISHSTSVSFHFPTPGPALLMDRNSARSVTQPTLFYSSIADFTQQGIGNVRIALPDGEGYREFSTPSRVGMGKGIEFPTFPGNRFQWIFPSASRRRAIQRRLVVAFHRNSLTFPAA